MRKVSVVIVWQDRNALAQAQAAWDVRHVELIAEAGHPRESVACARWRAFARATSNIVVSLGEHYSPPPNWLDRILAAHDRHPEADVIAGAVALAPGTRSYSDRAEYLWEYAHVAPDQLHTALPARIPGGHVIYRREALRESDFAGASSELDYHTTMAGRGLRFRCDPSLVVHYRPLPGYLARRFRWSLAEGSLRASVLPPWQRPLSALSRLALPPVLVSRALARTGAFGFAMMPAWSVFALSQAAGEFAGRLRG